MNQIYLIGIAFLGGLFLAAQGGLNARLGFLLKNPLLASLIAFFFSTLFALILIIGRWKTPPGWEEMKGVPLYLWFSGAFFSVIGISLYYYTIPRLGLSNMISIGLAGQLIFSLIAGHLGWLGLPQEPINVQRIIGALALMIGVLMINYK